MKKTYLIIDLGTGNSRVGLVDSDGQIKVIKTIENVYYVDNNYEDAQYFSPTFWKQQILRLCKEIIDEYPNVKIDGISSSGARETIILIDHDGNDFLGLPNIDNRGRKWVKSIKSKKYIYQKTGRWVTEDFPASKLLGLKKGRPDVFEKVKTFTSLSEWVAYIFTGKNVIEPSQACETQLFDIETRNWSTKLCKLFGLEEILLPTIKKGGEDVGLICYEMKKQLGLTYDIPFIIGGADTQVAVIGANIKQNDIAIVSGTTSPIVTLSNAIHYDEEERCWVDSFIGGELYQIETNPGVTGLNYQRIRNLLFDKVSYDDLEAALREVKDIKCIASFSSLDFEHGKGFPFGGFQMRPPFSAELNRVDLAWAVIGDIACSIYYQYRNLKMMRNMDPPYILGCGGGFQSKVLCQHIADLTQKTLKLPFDFHQSSIVGCIHICNQYFKIEGKGKINEFISYYPNKNTLISKYYDHWYEYRKKINN